MASSPTYNANLIVRAAPKVTKIKGTCGDSSALVNNATAGLYPPGSTFKIVTAAAALDSGAYTPNSPFYDPGYCTEYGKHVSNSGNPDQTGARGLRQRHARPGPRALDQLGLLQRRQAHRRREDPRVREAVRLLLAAAARHAADRAPRVRPLQERPGSSTRRTSPDRSGPARVRPVRMQATPLQMAMVGADDRQRRRGAAARTSSTIVAPDGSDRQQDDAADTRPRDQAADGCRAEPDDAARRPGRHGRDRRDPRGLKVAGKTGTAELDLGSVYDAWFVCFAPADHPRYVVAVVVEKQPNGFGGSISAPIAKAILEKLLVADHVSTL